MCCIVDFAANQSCKIGFLSDYTCITPRRPFYCRGVIFLVVAFFGGVDLNVDVGLARFCIIHIFALMF